MKEKNQKTRIGDLELQIKHNRKKNKTNFANKKEK